MQILFKLASIVIFLCSFSGIKAQDQGLFVPFDCREHAEIMEVPAFSLASVTADTLTLRFVGPEPELVADTVDGWRYWNFVENYNFGKNRGDLPMITDLQALHPFFRDQIVYLVELCKSKGIELAVVETYRTPAKQHEYKNMGKRYTSSGAGRSKHQYGLAIDVVPIVDGVAVWDNASLWRKIGITGEKLGLRWGGRWRKPYDPGHFEWTGGLTSSNLSAGSFPPIPKGDERYPCLEEDLKLLRKYWSEWETSQSSMTRK